MIAKFIAILLLARDISHREHWSAKSLSQHMALGEFYDAIIGLTDQLAEMYKGRHKTLPKIPQLNDEEQGDKTSAEMLRKYLELIEKMRYTAVEKTDTALQNKIDEIVGQFLLTLYKLDNLK